ncbi:MAG TPA: amidase [Gemmatimonadaceae bacterium]|jgi:amidase|nr:amidase [Gemmatimonadaceae bacterium]
MPNSLCFTSGRELAAMIRTKKISARELMAAHLEQIARVNPKINAVVAKLDDAKCLALAGEADRKLASGETTGPLHGIPWAFKDLANAVGFPATQGSPIYKDFMPTQDDTLVARIRAAGAIPIGKTNVPELGMGSHSYNKVYGTTLNPWDLTKSAGGSSGGAGAALATGCLPLADGTDLGGSLRNPANFNNVTAIRPTVGLVPVTPSNLPLMGFNVKGPLARSVDDVAFLLSVMAGADSHDPSCYPSDPSQFTKPLGRSVKGVRVAWCPDLGGLPLDRRVRAVLDAQRKTFVDLGCIVEDVCPDLSDAAEVFVTLRKWRSWISYAPLLAAHRDQLKPEAIWEIEEGAKVFSADVAHAMVRHTALMDRMRQFQEKYEFILCAVNQVPAFDAKIDWPHEVDGTPMENYVAWMKSTYMITATFRPSMSVPAGFTTDGLPVGIQIVGRYREDFSLLQFAHAFEQATNIGKRRPPIAT